VSIGEKLGKVWRRIDILDKDKLEFVEQQAKHLSQDLDSLIGSKTTFSIPQENLLELRKLHENCSLAFTDRPNINSILDRLHANQSLYKTTVELSASLKRLEET
jgi:hypothetical protein